MRRSLLTLSVAAAAVALTAAAPSGQAPAASARAKAARPYVTSRTPWGDPDLRGVSEADLRAERAGQAFERAPTLGGAAPGL